MTPIICLPGVSWLGGLTHSGTATETGTEGEGEKEETALNRLCKLMSWAADNHTIIRQDGTGGISR